MNDLFTTRTRRSGGDLRGRERVSKMSMKDFDEVSRIISYRFGGAWIKGERFRFIGVGKVTGCWQVSK